MKTTIALLLAATFLALTGCVAPDGPVDTEGSNKPPLQSQGAGGAGGADPVTASVSSASAGGTGGTGSSSSSVASSSSSVASSSSSVASSSSSAASSSSSSSSTGGGTPAHCIDDSSQPWHHPECGPGTYVCSACGLCQQVVDVATKCAWCPCVVTSGGMHYDICAGLKMDCDHQGSSVWCLSADPC